MSSAGLALQNNKRPLLIITACQLKSRSFGSKANLAINSVLAGMFPPEPSLASEWSRRRVIEKRSLRESKFEVQDANAGFFYYTDETEGLSVETFKGIVTSLDYTPPKTADERRCPRLQQCCVDVFPRFDEYRNLAFRDEKARLFDNYAIYMTERLNRGVIVVYGESPENETRQLRGPSGLRGISLRKWYRGPKDFAGRWRL